MTTIAVVKPAAAAFLLACVQVPSIRAQAPATPPDTSASAADRDRVMWTAVALERLFSERDYPSVLLLSALGRAMEERGLMALEGLDPLLSELVPSSSALSTTGVARSVGAPAFQRCREEADVVEGILCSMEQLVPLAPPAIARDITDLGSRLVVASSSAQAGELRVGASDATREPMEPFQAFTEKALERVWLVGARPTAAQDFDSVIEKIVGLGPRLGSDQSLAHAPELQQLLAAHPVVSESLGFPRPVASVSEEYASFLRGVTGSFEGLLLVPVTKPDGGPMASTSELGAEAESVRRWAAGRSFVYLVSRSAELAGAERHVSDRMRTLGTAAVDLQSGAASFQTSVASLGRDLAVAALSGNVLGVVSRITSFFRSAPGAHGVEAADDVRALREGIQSMRNELGVGIDSVDQRFDELFRVVDARFSLLEGLIDSSGRDTRDELAALHEDVVGLGERLDLMSATVTSLVQAGFDREYARTLTRCLEHRERYAPPWNEMPFAMFTECLADFRARAVVDAMDALVTDQSTPVDDASLVSALADTSFTNLSYRLPLLARAASQRFGHALTNTRGLANTLEWTVASEGYVTLLGDWPEHARAITAGDLEAMRSVGVNLLGALQSITVGADGGVAPLLDRVLRYYETRLSELRIEADSLARRHRQQTLLRVPAATLLASMVDAKGMHPSFDPPSHLLESVPSEVRTAALLGLDEITLTYHLEWDDSVTRGNSRRRFLIFGRRHDRYTHTRPSIRVELRSSLHGTIAGYRASGPFVLKRTEEMDGDERSDRVHAAVDHIPNPEDHFRAAIWPAVAADPSAWTSDLVDQDVLFDLQDRIEAELKLHSTAGLNNVFAAVCSDGPGNDAMSRPDRTSAVRIRDALSGLSAARALLGAYLRLSMPDALETETALRDSLVGPAAIADRSTLCAVVAAGDSPLPTLWLDEELSRRSTATRAALDRVFASRHRTSRPPTLVDSTLERLGTAIRLQRLRSAVATSN